MAITTFTGDLSAFFPAGTSLEARPASNWAAHKLPPAPLSTPPGSATATATSASSGVLSLMGLADNTEYFVSDAVGTRYVRITTFPERQELMSGQINAPNGIAGTDANGKVPFALMAGRAINWQDAAYGADPTGVASSAAALHKALRAAGLNGSIDLGEGTFLVDDPTTANGVGTTTNASPTVTGATGTWYKGQTITGTGVPANTVVNSVSGTTLTLSQNATASGTVSLSSRTLGFPLPPGATGIEIFGAGRDRTFLKLGSGTKRLFDLFTTADYQTSQNITLRDFTVDGDNQSTSGNEHVVLGNLVGGNWAQRANVDHIRVFRVDSINVLTGTGASSRQNISIGSRHLAAAETATSLTDILVEDCNFAGGNGGVAVLGSVASGTACEVYHDRITIRKVQWNSGVNPASHGSQINKGFMAQIGGTGYGDLCLVDDCSGQNSGDVGVEIDGMTNGKVTNSRMYDCYNGSYLLRNFHPPTSIAAQKNVVRDCEAVNNALDPSPTGAVSCHFQVGGDSGTANYVFGEAVFENCISRFDTAMATLGPSSVAVGKGQSVYADNVQARLIRVNKLRIGAGSLAITNNDVQRFPTWIGIRNALPGGRVELENVSFRLVGSRSGSTDNQWRMIAIHGADVVLKVDNIAFDFGSLSGLSTNDTFYRLIVNDVTTTLRGTVSRIKDLNAPGGSGSHHHGVYVGSSATVTITGKLVISGCDFSKIVGTGTSVLDYNINSNQLGKVLRTDLVATRSGTGAEVTSRTAVTTGFTSGDLTSTSPVVIRNTDVQALDYVVKGGTVSAVERSDDNSTYDTVAAATGAEVLNVLPGQYVRVTYTVAPTVFKRPAR